MLAELTADDADEDVEWRGKENVSLGEIRARRLMKRHRLQMCRCRAIDLYADRMSYLHLNAPGKGSDDFHTWLKGFKAWIKDMETANEWMSTRMEASGGKIEGAPKRLWSLEAKKYRQT